jgi:glycosyltransferase involved in cell wall biosynthesis
MSPTVSVIMPVLNGAAHLDEAIGSILTQTFEDLELIVVDDGSEDESREIVAGFAARDPRARLIGLERDPRTVSGARADNVGQLQARGEFIARMDQDDVALPERLTVQLALMAEQGLDVCGGQARYCGDRDEPIWFPETHAAIERELIFRPAMIHAAQTTRARVRRAQPLDETTPGEDYEWQTRMAPQVRFGNAAEVVVLYRVHAGQGSQVRRARMLRDWGRFRFRYFFGLYPEARLDDFQAVNMVAVHGPIPRAQTLERAGQWLARFADLPDARLKRRMRQRWDEACALAEVAAGALGPIRDRYAEAIGG